MHQKHLSIALPALMLPLLAAVALPALADTGLRPTYNEVSAQYGRSAVDNRSVFVQGSVELGQHWVVGGVSAWQV